MIGRTTRHITAQTWVPPLWLFDSFTAALAPKGLYSKTGTKCQLKNQVSSPSIYNCHGSCPMRITFVKVSLDGGSKERGWCPLQLDYLLRFVRVN